MDRDTGASGYPDLLLQDQYAAIGLLITAKGLLRFSEKDRQEEKTEYVLIDR